MFAVPTAFLPLVFTMTAVATVTLALGGAATSPVFLACIVSYTTVAGGGVVHALIRGKPAQKEEEDPKEELEVAAQKEVTKDDTGEPKEKLVPDSTDANAGEIGGRCLLKGSMDM